MKKIKLLNLIIITLFLSACTKNTVKPNDNNEESLPKASDYCLMFYMSGGDPAHDVIFYDYIERISKHLRKDGASMTYILKTSGSKDKVFRYYSEDSEFKRDETWSKNSDYEITSDEVLTEYINWSAEKFPNKKYILIPCGHGGIWDPINDDPTKVTRSTMYDGITNKTMTSSDLARGIQNSSIKKLELLITNNCIQNSIETISEWKEACDYVICSSSYLPDMGGDYAYLYNHLGHFQSTKDLVIDYSKHITKFLLDYNDAYGRELSVGITAIDMAEIGELNTSLKATFEHMFNSLDKKSILTDLPCVPGRTYRAGYKKALKDAIGLDVLNYELYTRDLNNFLMNATTYTGDLDMLSIVSNFQDKMNKAIIFSEYLDVVNGKKTPYDISFNIFTDGKILNGNTLKAYQASIFDQATDWSKLLIEISK